MGENSKIEIRRRNAGRHGATPMSAKNKPSDPAWDAAIRQAYLALDAIPQDVKAVLVRATDDICDIGEDEQVPPVQMGMALAALIAGLCMAHVRGDVHDNSGVDEFILKCHAAMHVGVAKVRIAGGFRP